MPYNKSLDEIFEEFDSNTHGLTNEEVNRRLEQFGKNVIQEGKQINPLRLLIAQFSDLLVLILIAAGLITAFLGILEKNPESVVDVLAIGIVVLLNAFLGFYQEYSAEKAIAALLKFTTSDVTVVRDNSKVKVSIADLVPGDIVVLEAGNTIPADIRVIEAFEFKVNESVLTGESLPVRKKDVILSENLSLGDRVNILFKGTTVTSGSGSGIVVATGHQTELGKIASSLQEIEAEPTSLQRRLGGLAKQITIAVVLLAILIIIIGIFLGQQISEMIFFSIGLAVAAVPEGLPAVLTLSLAIAVNKMAKKKSLIRKLPAVEVLGSTTIICTDKTGTLTKNEMTVKQIWTNDYRYTITGTGYQNNGDIINAKSGKGADIKTESSLNYLLTTCLLCNEATIEGEGEKIPFKIFGDPTEVSLLVLGAKKGMSVKNLSETWEKIFLFPFDSERKLMSVIAKNKFNEKYFILVKGAPDVLLNLCATQYSQDQTIDLDEAARNAIKTISEGFSKNFAYRNLGIAIKEIDKETTDTLVMVEDHNKVERDLTFVGIVGMIDPPREQSKFAIAKAIDAGIKTIMITGDHKETAIAIGKSIGLVGKKEERAITGIELDQMTELDLEKSLETTKIFARVNPNHKLLIVNALKNRGEIVVMTGDGVNDAPALKRADVGVAMGISGTDVAKESSSMILLDDNFANIVEAVSVGRVVYDNMKKFIAFLLSANTGEVLTVLFALIIGLMLFNKALIPLLAIQLLFINLVTDTFPALALGVDTPEEDIMKRNPRNPTEPLLDKDLISMILISGVTFAILALFCFFSVFDFTVDFATATIAEEGEILRMPITMAFVSLIVNQLVHAVNTSERGTIFSWKTLKNYWLLLSIIFGLFLVIVATEVALFQALLHTASLEPINWLVIGTTAIPVVIVEEIRKKFMRRQ